MDALFFVPATKIDKLNYISYVSKDSIIVDLEDSVKRSKIKEHIDELLSLGVKDYAIRVPIHGNNSDLDFTHLDELIVQGCKRFVLPKLSNEEEVSLVFNKLIHHDVSCILLVETAQLFLSLNQIMQKYGDLFYGLALGIHDLNAELGAKYDFSNTIYFRQHLQLVARAHRKMAIDVASMETNNGDHIKHEIINGFDLGYDAKFYIHPYQVEVHNSIKFYSEHDLEWAIMVGKELSRAEHFNEFSPIVLNGEIVERPHLNRAIKILKYHGYKTEQFG